MTSDAMTAILAAGSSIALPDSDRIAERRANTSAALSGPLTDRTAADWADLGGRPALWIHPATGPSGSPVVLYLHGGAFEVGSPTDYQAFCSRLAHGRAEVAHLPGVRQRDFERALCAGTDDRR